MNRKTIEKEQEQKLSFFPNEYLRFIHKLTKQELILLKESLEKNLPLDECDYITFCNHVIALAKNHIGKYSGLELLAAEIAYDIRRLEDLEFLSERSNNPKLLASLAKGLIEKNDIQKATEIIKLVEPYIDFNDKIFLQEYLLAKGLLLKSRGDFIAALLTTLAAKEVVNSLQSELSESEFFTYKARILIEESNILLYLGRFAEAFETIRSGLSIAKETGNRIFATHFEILYGNYLVEYERDFVNGRKHHRKAAKIAQELRNPYLIAIALEAAGFNFVRQRKLKEGLNFCQQAIKILENIGDIRRKAQLINIVANLNISFGEVATALQMLKELEKQIGSDDLTTILNLINANIRADNLDEAENYLRRAKQLIRGKGWIKGEFQLIFFEGLIQLQSGRFERAEQLFNDAYNMAMENKLTYLALQANIQLANVLVNKNLIFPSKRNHIKALKIIEELSEQVAPAVDSFDFDSVELLRAILHFSNREYQPAKEILLALLQNFEKFNEEIRKAIAIDYLDKIEQAVKREQELCSKNAKTDICIASSQLFTQNIQAYIRPLKTKEIKPKMFLIITDAGIPLYSYYFESDFQMDKTLISGFLSAILYFSEELQATRKKPGSKPEKEKLEAIKHKQFEIILEKQEGFCTAIIAEKETYSLRRKLLELTAKLAKYLQRFEIDYLELTSRQRKYIERLVKDHFE